MKVAVYGRPEFTMMKAFAEGCELSGHKIVWRRDNVFTADQVEPFDVVAVPGLRGRCRDIRDAYQAKGIPVVVIDLGHLRRDLEYRQVGLNRLAWIPPFTCKDDRWKALGLVNRTRENKKGKYILFVGQVPDDASHGLGTNGYFKWVQETADAIREETDLPIRFRPHPDFYVAVRSALGGIFNEVSPQNTPLEDDLRSARCVVTFCSTTGIEALMQGIPVVCDKSAPYSAFAHTSVRGIADMEPPSEMDVQQFLNRMSYGQWTLKELSEGLAADFILGVVKGEVKGEAPAPPIHTKKEESHGSHSGGRERKRGSGGKQLPQRQRRRYLLVESQRRLLGSPV